MQEHHETPSKKHCKPCHYTCPLTGFKFCCNTTTLTAMLVMALWVSAFQWFWHTQMLHDLYNAHADLWRTDHNMNKMMCWIWSANVLTGVVATYIFAQGFEHAGCREGLRFGIIMTLFACPAIMISYAVMPVSAHLFHMWLAGAALEFVLGGILLGCLFRCCNKQCH